MKKYLVITILFLSCNRTETFVLDMPEVDSVMAKSEKTSDSAKVILKVSDMKEQIGDMKSQMSNMNALLKEKPKTITVRDTVYITEKKNFWGKTKTSVDSTSQKIDSTENK
jgi:hypothetical protein